MAGKWKDLIDRTFGKVGTKRRDEQDNRVNNKSDTKQSLFSAWVKEELAKMPSRSEAFSQAAHTFVNLTDDKLVALGEFRELLITGMELSATTVKEVAEVGRTTTRYVEEWIEGTSRPTRGQQCWVVEALMKKLAVKTLTLNAEMQDLISKVIHLGGAFYAAKNVVGVLNQNGYLKPHKEVLNLDELIGKKIVKCQDSGEDTTTQVLLMLTDLGVI